MVDVDKIKAEIFLKGMRLNEFADKIGIPAARFYDGIYKKKFSDEDMLKIQRELKFDNPWAIFFKD